MAFDIRAVTNYILDLAESDGVPVTHMKLQKLLYYAHGWHLGLGLGPLFNDTVEAWKYGPVIPTVFRKFRDSGNVPIKGRWRIVKRSLGGPYARLRRTAVGRVVHTPVLPDEDPAAESAREVLRRVWAKYGQLSALRLSAMTHEPGTPWHVVWRDMGHVKRLHQDIPDHTIEQHFRNFVEARSA